MSSPILNDQAPVVDALTKLDEQYIVIQNQLQDEIKALKASYAKKFQPLIDERFVVLTASKPDAPEGTPALPEFWSRVIQVAEEFEGYVETWDLPVLKYLDDIRCDLINPDDDDLGFTIQFRFKPNPYFTNNTLTKTIKSEKTSSYIDQVEILEIVCDEINWKEGMDITVETVTKKKSGGGSKKKPSGPKITPRDSFFRFFFRNLGAEHPVPVETMMDDEYDEDDQDDAERMQMYISQDYELSTSLRDYIIPHAIKWFTGEALGSEVDEEEDDDEDEEDEDEDEDEEDEDVSPSDQDKTKQDCKQQ
jgi:nucleosome assembly protein 1-like 1